MGFKLVNKNNMGIFTILILVVLLSQAKFFNFLTDTALGRLVLLSLIIYVSYANKILGLLAVLAVIIGFNYTPNTVYAYNYYEGFDVSGNRDLSGNLIAKLKTAKTNINTDITTATSSTSTSGSSTETFKGREGFCMTDRETNMLRGKPSNAIPVFKAREQGDDVEPTDKSVFTSDYSTFK